MFSPAAAYTHNVIQSVFHMVNTAAIIRILTHKKSSQMGSTQDNMHTATEVILLPYNH